MFWKKIPFSLQCRLLILCFVFKLITVAAFVGIPSFPSSWNCFSSDKRKLLPEPPSQRTLPSSLMPVERCCHRFHPETSGIPGVPLIDQISAAGSPGRRQDAGQTTQKLISSTRPLHSTIHLNQSRHWSNRPRWSISPHSYHPLCLLLPASPQTPGFPEHRPAALASARFCLNRRALSMFDSLTAAIDDHRELKCGEVTSVAGSLVNRRSTSSRLLINT